jgi:hypothetical protein
MLRIWDQSDRAALITPVLRLLPRGCTYVLSIVDSEHDRVMGKVMVDYWRSSSFNDGKKVVHDVLGCWILSTTSVVFDSSATSVYGRIGG